MKTNLFSAGFLLFLTLFSCSGKKGPSEVLTEANTVHKEALVIYEEAHDLFDKAKENGEGSQDSLLTVRLDSIHDILHGWKDGLYEVPGFEHDHDHGDEGHDHKHNLAPSMTDQSMLEYQENARAAIIEIRDKLSEMTTK